MFLSFFFFNDPATTEIYTLSLHDALPISPLARRGPLCGHQRLSDGWDAGDVAVARLGYQSAQRRHAVRSEEHTSELQSRLHLVCRLLLEKKKKKKTKINISYKK